MKDYKKILRILKTRLGEVRYRKLLREVATVRSEILATPRSSMGPSTVNLKRKNSRDFRNRLYAALPHLRRKQVDKKIDISQMSIDQLYDYHRVKRVQFTPNISSRPHTVPEEDEG